MTLTLFVFEKKLKAKMRDKEATCEQAGIILLFLIPIVLWHASLFSRLKVILRNPGLVDGSVLQSIPCSLHRPHGPQKVALCEQAELLVCPCNFTFNEGSKEIRIFWRVLKSRRCPEIIVFFVSPLFKPFCRASGQLNIDLFQVKYYFLTLQCHRNQHQYQLTELQQFPWCDWYELHANKKKV